MIVATDHSTILEREQKIEKVPPAKMYNVVVLNNKVTNMDFVVKILTDVFNMSSAVATEHMFDVHFNGRAQIGPYKRPEADNFKEACLTYARSAPNIANKQLETTIEPV